MMGFSVERLPVLLRLMLPRLRAYRGMLIWALLLLPVSSVFAMMVPYLTMLAIDDFIVPGIKAGSLAPFWEDLVELMVLAGVAVVLGYLADAFYVVILQRTGQHLIADLRDIAYGHSLRLPRSYFDTHPIGTILTRVTSDIEALGESLATNTLSLVADALKTMAYLGMMFYLNWRLTMVVLVIIPVLVVVIRFFQVRVRRTFFLARQALSEATGYLQECLSGIKTIQLFAAEKKALAGFKARNWRFYQAQNRSNFYDALLFSVVEGVTTLSLALVLWYAAGALLAGALTLGVLVAFLEYIQRLFIPVREFSQQIAVIQRALAALEHINELCGAPIDPAEREEYEAETTAAGPSDPASKDSASKDSASKDSASNETGTEASASEGHFESLVFENVRFRYTRDGPEILKGVSFRLTRGQTLALVGATGSGKSTIVRLLTRAYGGYEGSIRINGEELNTIPAHRLGRLISVVHQGVFLFKGGVAFNIGLERPGLDRDRIEAAAGYVQADGFIAGMEGGFEADISQGGMNISAGQAQLISFARAVAAGTELIVLDEATSSVDSITENLIQEAVGKLYRDKTVIAIAHRLSTIRSADAILVMDAGEIREAGDHEALMARNGAYAKLVRGMEKTPAAPPPEPGETPARQ